MRLPKGGIGFFDSGIGGLTVMDASQRVIKEETFYYYGDNKHAPYGNLPQKKIRKYLLRALKKFYRLRVRAVVLACNTATAVCIDEFRKKFSFPIATLITGCVWMLWHVPLWFVIGASQQNMNFALYAIYGLILSFWLATIHKKTKSIFSCCVFHGFSNLMLSFFVIKINWILILGLIASLVFTTWLYYKGEKVSIR
jgi:hypothetical protein